MQRPRKIRKYGESYIRGDVYKRQAAERVNKTDEASESGWENTVTITASSIEELLKKISDYQQNERMNTVQTTEERMVGGHIDYKG